MTIDDHSVTRNVCKLIKSNKVSKEKKHSTQELYENIHRRKCQNLRTEHSTRMIHVCRKGLTSKDRSNHIHEHRRPLQVCQGKFPMKHVHVTHRQMETSDYDPSQIETIDLSLLDSIPKSLNTTTKHSKPLRV